MRTNAEDAEVTRLLRDYDRTVAALTALGIDLAGIRPHENRAGAIVTPADGINMREAADRLGVHWQTVRNWIQAGQLPATRFGPSGKIIRIDPADLARVRRPA